MAMTQGCKRTNYSTEMFSFTIPFILPFRKLTVMDFMKKIVSESHETGKVTRPVTCKHDSTLQSVIHILASQSIHRIYTVDGQDRVIGVITLRDVISCYITEPSYHFDDYYGFAVKEMLNQ